MFEDIIGDVRNIEILHNGYNGIWKLSRIKDLKPAFLFRYVDKIKIVYRAECDPFIDDRGFWAIIGTQVDVRRYFR